MIPLPKEGLCIRCRNMVPIKYGDATQKAFVCDKCRIKELAVDAERYKFLRDSDNWGEDSGDTSWEALAESTMCSFDEIVDSRIASCPSTTDRIEHLLEAH